MQYENLLVSLEDGVLVLTLNRPKALNALNLATMRELRHFFSEEALKYPDIHGIILTGAGEKAFVAGADISEFTALDSEAGADMARQGHEIFFLIERFHKPVIAAVNGFALGGGCELAIACHLRVAGEKAKFGQPEVNLGIIPGYGGTQRMVQLIGKGKALELLMTGDMIGAEEAHRLGLANALVEQGQEVAKAKAILAKIGQKAPLAITKVIDCVNALFDDTRKGYEVEVENFAACVRTADFKEGATAFLEKRPAVFKGK